ncbi:MAG: AMP-binding protein [Thermodesulfobacteriota bacterium]
MSRWLNAGEILRINAALYPNKMGAKDLNRGMTFKEWNERSCRLANALLGLGLEKGDRFAVIAYNRVEWMEIYAAAAKAGLVAVPVSFRLTPLEYEYLLKDSGAKAFIVEQPFVEGADSIRRKLPSLKGYVYLGQEPAPEGYHHYEEIIAQASDSEPPVKVRHTDVWTFMYTSGTTGKPKGAVRTHESYTAFYIVNVAEMGFTREDLGLLVMPMFHVNSIFYSFTFTYIQTGVCVYNRVSFDPEHLLKTLAEEKITFTSLVPTHYIMMLALPDEIKNKYDVSRVSKLLCSSAPARRDTKLGILDHFKNSRLFEAYGSTEAGLVTLLRPEDQIRKLGSIGREIMGTDRIKLLDKEGKEVPDGEVGELFSRGPAFFTEYWNLPEVTREAFRDEYFSAGDMARRDEEGYYYLLDRKKNMIITGGENVYPSEIENVIGGHPKVKDVAIIGVPDSKWGEAVKAIIILHEGHAPDKQVAKEIMDWCRNKIAGFKRPKTIDFIREEEMPRTAQGKILHRALRERYGKWSDQM